jgi:predicted small metal-binding protein
MAKNKMSLACRDVGMDCRFVAVSKDQDKLMKKAQKHLKKKHKMATIPQETINKARAAIRTVT